MNTRYDRSISVTMNRGDMGPDINQQPPQPLTQAPPEVPQQPATAWPQQPVPPKKKSLLWLWITLGAVLLLVVGMVVAFFVIKSAADTAASEYMTSAKTHLNDISSKLDSNSSDPGALYKSITGLTRPSLKESFMGETLSSSYKSAKSTQLELEGKVVGLTLKLTDYANVYTFYIEDVAIEKEATDIVNSGTDNLKILTDFQAWLKKYQSFIDNSNLPSDLADAKASISSSNTKMLSSWNDLVTAYKAGNSPAYNAARSAYSNELPTMKKGIETIVGYYSDLSTKVDNATSEFQSYADTVK